MCDCGRQKKLSEEFVSPSLRATFGFRSSPWMSRRLSQCCSGWIVLGCFLLSMSERANFRIPLLCQKHIFQLKYLPLVQTKKKKKRIRNWSLKCFVLSDKKTSKYSWYSCVLFGSGSGLIHGLVSPTVYWPVQIFRSIKTRDFYCKVGVRDDVMPRHAAVVALGSGTASACMDCPLEVRDHGTVN